MFQVGFEEAKYALLPVAGAVGGAVVGGPMGFATGMRLGITAAIGGGVRSESWTTFPAV